MFVLEVFPDHGMFRLFNPLIEVTTHVTDDNLFRTKSHLNSWEIFCWLTNGGFNSVTLWLSTIFFILKIRHRSWLIFLPMSQNRLRTTSADF